MNAQVRRMGSAALLSVLLMLGIAGCETSEDTSTADSDVSGTWLYSDTDGRQSTWALVQSDDASIAGAGTDGETIIGSMSGDSIYMDLTYSSSNSTASLNGTVATTTMAGTYTNSLTGSGSWTAVKTD